MGIAPPWRPSHLQGSVERGACDGQAPATGRGFPDDVHGHHVRRGAARARGRSGVRSRCPFRAAGRRVPDLPLLGEPRQDRGTDVQGPAGVLGRRASIVAIRVRDPHLDIGCWYRESRHFDSASAVKATILGALLRKADAEHRALTAQERRLAWRMITESDNGAATALWDDVGRYRLGRFLRLTGMHQTLLSPTGYWGLTRI